MRRSRFAEEQIIGILKEHEAGVSSSRCSLRLPWLSSPHEHRHRHDAHHLHAHDAGIPAGELHNHWYRHAPMVHRHPHYPDIHHRHGHGA